MKWLFYTLCTLNILALLLGWSNMRALQLAESYTESPEVSQLQLLTAYPLLGEEGEKWCTLLGPYGGEVASSLKRSLGKLDVEALVIAQDVDLAPTYWVYYDRFDISRTAEMVLDELSSGGFDAYLIKRGKLKGNISLGVFKNIDSARRMRQILAKSGYEAKLTEIKQTEQSYWVLLDQLYLSENKEKIMLLLAEKKVATEMRQIFCKSVASEN